MSFNDLLKNKKAVNLIAVLLMGIIVVICGGYFTDSEKTEEEENPQPVNIERRLEEILSTIKGVGKVSVFVLLEDYGESNFAKDVKLSEAGSEEAIVIADNTPVVAKMQTPEVKGVIVTAQGAASEEVKKKIKSAVETVLGVMPHRVEVLERK